MTNLVYKAGEQSSENPYEFVMSTPDVDRMGDIVEQDWNLKHFRKNPIALFAHNNEMPIGVWKKVKVVEDTLIGTLELAAEGTSSLIDRLRKLIEQRILRAVSVGFYPKEAEPLDPDKPWNGYRLWKNELMECSLVSVPANPYAVSLAKGLDNDTQRLAFSNEVDPAFTSFVKQTNGRIQFAESTVIRSTTQRVGTQFVDKHRTKRISLDQIL